MSWSNLIEQEKAFFVATGKRLASLAELAASTKNNALESIYASVYNAYNNGLIELGKFESDLRQIEAASQTGMYQQSQIEALQASGMPQSRWPVAVHMLGAQRCILRPSEMFRAMLTSSMQDIFAAIQQLVVDPKLPQPELISDIQIISEILCSFGAIQINEPEEKLGFWGNILQSRVAWSILSAALSGLITYFVTTWLQSRKLNEMQQDLLLAGQGGGERRKNIALLSDDSPKRRPIGRDAQLAAAKEDEESDDEDGEEEESDDDAQAEAAEAQAEAKEAAELAAVALEEARQAAKRAKEATAAL